MTNIELKRVLGVLTLALVTAAAPVEAQRDQTLLGRRGSSHVGGFGGPVVKFSRVAGQDAVISGGRGGVILNRSLIIGGGGYSIASENIRTGFAFGDQEEAALGLDYGGLELEYVFRPSKLVHLSVYTLFGGGQAHYETVVENNAVTSRERLESNVLVFEPALNIEVNVTNWFRTGIGAGYRYVNGSDLPRATDGALGAATGTVTFKFGAFR